MCGRIIIEWAFCSRSWILSASECFFSIALSVELDIDFDRVRQAPANGAKRENISYSKRNLSSFDSMADLDALHTRGLQLLQSVQQDSGKSRSGTVMFHELDKIV
jgi:hypothetical protein